MGDRQCCGDEILVLQSRLGSPILSLTPNSFHSLDTQYFFPGPCSLSRAVFLGSNHLNLSSRKRWGWGGGERTPTTQPGSNDVTALSYNCKTETIPPRSKG